MTRLRISFGIGVVALGLVLGVAPAHALNIVSYVSRPTGSDANSCSTPAAPCQTMSGALAKTEPSGEIKCLDNHAETGFVINKPITIDCGAPGSVFSGIAAANGVEINLDEATFPNGVVTLRSLTIDGLIGQGAFGVGVH